MISAAQVSSFITNDQTAAVSARPSVLTSGATLRTGGGRKVWARLRGRFARRISVWLGVCQPRGYAASLCDAPRLTIPCHAAPSRLTTYPHAAIYGPILATGHAGSSPTLVLEMMQGKLPMAPRFSFAAIDVRDVARAQIIAMENEAVSGKIEVWSVSTVRTPPCNVVLVIVPGQVSLRTEYGVSRPAN